MDHREIAEKILEQGNCDFRPCKGCVFDNGRCTIFNAGERDMERVKQWLKDNPKEQSMTNEQKIKWLEAEIQKAKDRITNEQAYTNFYIKERQAEIEELKKPKYELYRLKNPTEKYYSMILSGSGLNDRFEKLQDAEYYAKGMRIYIALANFASHNDPTEKDRAWDGKLHHWYIYANENADCIRFDKDLTTIYFSTEELAEAALQMIKDERLI